MISCPKSLLSFLQLSFLCAVCQPYRPLAAAEAPYQVGVSKIDITPDYPIRLCGYAVRKTESQGIVQHLYAKALAIGSDKDPNGPAILLTVDNTGVPASVRNEVLERLRKRTRNRVQKDHFALCSSHSHTAPCLAGNLPTLFGEPLPPDQEAHVQRYTRELIDALEKVSLEALKNRKPSRLFWSQGSANFAANRRTRGGPVDHDMPVLVVTDSAQTQKVRAVFVNYACHCTTLGGDTNMICGDWAGYAQEYLEQNLPGAIALIAIGCGADANPMPRNSLEFARQHGREIEQSVNQVLARTLKPLSGKLECREKRIDIPFDTLPTREQWEKAAQRNDYAGYHARVNLAKLDRGETIPSKLAYSVQAWNFGNDLSMVFLPGEVVVDYSKRLKTEFDSNRLWVNAYANDVPCYIPSERILKEGGYEGGDAMIYYDKPARLAPGIENMIVAAVHDVVSKNFDMDQHQLEFPDPKSPAESLSTLRTRSNYDIQLVASEPLIVDPVAIDWGPDGKLWVVEMRDYPAGMDGHWKPGSRIKYLEDTDGDGKYDKATIFLDNLPFATGVTAWRKGALICAAPDIIYAEATPGHQQANIVKKLFSGFYTENYQARVNSLSLGLDNWIYGANGLLGGVIQGEARGVTAASANPVAVDIRGRDFRMHPDTGAFEPVTGLTQQGRVRDDWGNWFGCDNSTIAWQYPLPEHYLRRNPHVPAPSPRVSVATGDDPNLLHPLSRTLERFNDPGSANRVTSGCGMGIYRDDLLGPDLYGNEFTCEPVHNLVHRLVLDREGVTIKGLRAPNEQNAEFLASSDNWFRPVQVRTGPDGALYVVDMYRFVIEHPRWIAAERLAKLDVRAGDDKGRIYRIVPKGKKLRSIPDLTRLSSEKLAFLLDTPNGTERDRVHQELICRGDQSVARQLEQLAARAQAPAVRLQALCVLDGLHALNWPQVERALQDPEPGVVANALRLSEHFFDNSPDTLARVIELTRNQSMVVRFQLALSLGESGDSRAGVALADLARTEGADPWMRAAILSSARPHAAQLLKTTLALDVNAPARGEMISALIATAVGEGNSLMMDQITTDLIPAASQTYEPWRLHALINLLDAQERRPIPYRDSDARSARLAPVFLWANGVATDSKVNDALRSPAIRLVGRDARNRDADLRLLGQLLDEPLSAACREAVFDSLKRCGGMELPAMLLTKWNQRPPSQRQSCIQLLLARPEWTRALLDAVSAGPVAPAEISLPDRQRLLKHSDKQIQQTAATLWKPNTSRAEVLSQYQDVGSLSGDTAKGALVFSKTCSTCHYLRGQGHAVGPDLAPLANKSPADFLLAILDPNAAVEPRFIAYNIDTRDGRSLTGVVSAETATSLTLVQSGGVQEKVLRGDIQQIRASGLSLMPEGLEQTLSKQDLADLIGYLKTSPRQFGSASPAQAEAAQREFLREPVTGVAKLIFAFDQLPYPSWLGTLPMPYTRQTDGHAKLTWQTAPVPGDLKPNDTFKFRLPAAMGFASNPSGKFTLAVDNKASVDFDVSLTDKSWQANDGKLRLDYTVMENNEEDSNGVLVIEAAGSLLEPGKPSTIEVTGSAAHSQRWFGIYLLQPQMAAGTGAK